MAGSPSPGSLPNIKSSRAVSWACVVRCLDRWPGGRCRLRVVQPCLSPEPGHPRATRPANEALELEEPRWGARGAGKQLDRVLFCCLTRRSRDRTVQVDQARQGAYGEGAARSLTRSVLPILL